MYPIHVNTVAAVKRMKGKVNRTADKIFLRNKSIPWWRYMQGYPPHMCPRAQRHTHAIPNLPVCLFEEEAPIVLVLMRKPFLVFPCTQAMPGCLMPMSPLFGWAECCLLAPSLMVYAYTILCPPALCPQSCPRQGAAREETAASTAQ